MIRNPFARLLRWVGYHLGFGAFLGAEAAKARMHPTILSNLRGPR